MADYDINAVTRRVVYDGSSGLGPYAFSFEILATDDITVYFNASVLTITTDYTVTINANGTGSINIVTGGVVPSTPVAADQITIVGARDIERTTDFVTAGDLRASALNEQLDGQIIMIQQVAEENQRGMRAPVYDPALVQDGGVVDMTLPTKASRAGKTLAFDSNGNPIVGEDIGNWRGDWAASVSYTVRDLVKDPTNSNVYRVNTAHTSSGSAPISSNADVAKFDLVVDAAAAGASAAAAAASAAEAETAQTAAEAAQAAAETAETNAETAETNAETAETNAETAQTAAETAQAAAETAQAAAELAYDNFDDRYLGAKASDPTLDNDGDALIDGALYFDTTNNVMKVYDLGTTAWLRTVPTSAEQTNINTVSGISANVTTVAGISSDVTSVAGISSDVTTVAADGTDIGTVAGISANVTTVAGISGNVTTVAGVSANVTTVAGVSADVTTVAGDSADIQAVAADATDIGTVATNIANVNAVGGDIANVNTVATNIVDVNSFANQYRVGASDPTTSLDEGDLAYNTTDNALKFYNGTSWTSIQSGLTDIVGDVTPQLGGDLDTNGNDINFGDNDKAIFGAGSDLQVYHNGNDSVVRDAGTGDLLLAGSTNVKITTSGFGETMAEFATNGAATLYYNNAEKFATTSTGISITGSVTATSFAGDGSALTNVGFDAGTLLLFQQTAAPTGWTKQTTHNNKALRVVSGTAGSGGSVAFTTAFGTPAVSGSVSLSGNLGSTSLSVNQIASHSHNQRRPLNSGGVQFGNPNRNSTPGGQATSSTGGGGSHNHTTGNLAGSLSSASTSINVQYVDVILAAKD